MTIELASFKFKTEWHNHRCPICRKVRREPNEVCGKISGDHVFACIVCLQDHRLRLGTDVLLDAYLDQQQVQRLNDLAPDQKSVELDQRDMERQREQIEEAVRIAREQGPKKYPEPVTLRELLPQTGPDADPERVTVITQEEVYEELKKIEKEESI